MGAVHFGGSEPWGVTGCHGFVGPAITRMFESEIDLAPLQNASIFDYADALAPPGLVHLAKVTLEATSQRWRRNIEIDGHEAFHSDSDWNTGLPPTSKGLISQFAVFHYADQPQVIEQRRRIDEAIRRFVAAFQETSDTDLAADWLESAGFDTDLVHEVLTVVPIAFGRVVVGALGLTFSPYFTRINREGETQTLKLMQQPVFARSTVLSAEMLASPHRETVKAMGLTSGEVRAINRALQAGSKPQDLVLAPPLIVAPGTDQSAIDQAIKRLQQHLRPPPASKPAKPWWRLW
jgi:hypothetical protein